MSLLERESAPSQSPRSLPSQVPGPHSRAPSLSLRLPGTQPLPPLSIYTFGPAPSGFKSPFLPIRCLLGTGPWPACISCAFLVPPLSDLALTLSFLPYPCEQPFPSQNHSLHPPCTCLSQGAQLQAPPRVSLPSWGWHTQGWKDSPPRWAEPPPPPRTRWSQPPPTSHLPYSTTWAPELPLQAG